jgi:UDP-N-acetylmuramyl tripeptide synthase
MSREVPKPELEVAVRNRFQCVRHRRLTETACLRGRVLVVWHRTIRVNPGMQVEMIVTVVLVVGARTGRLRRTADTSVRVVMGLHVMAATTVTRSTLHHLKSRIRTRCVTYSLQAVSLSFIHRLFSFAIYGSAPRSL